MSKATGFKQSNAYVEWLEKLEPGLYVRIPKAVWAAIALSLATCGGDRFKEDAAWGILNEWAILHTNDIIPQKPCKTVETRPHNYPDEISG